jgi:endonuclease/exonuclease/phosphatase (EEP) superfamily protein YafD
MVGNGMFNFLNLRLQQIIGTKTPFGGLSLITVGDLFQLKPVFDKWIFENTNDCYGAFATNMWKEYFTLFELTEIMRQKDDKHFAELLNRLREGNHTQSDIEELKKRILKLKPGEENYPINKTHLFSTNVQANDHNTTIYQASQTDKAKIKCIDIIVGDMSDDLKKKMKEKIPDDPTKTMGLYNVVSVAVRAKYDLTTNVNVNDGMTNGADCIIQKIDYRVRHSNRPSIIWVSFPQTDIGRNHRKEFAHLFTNNVDKTWTSVLEITRQFKISKRNQCQVLRRQYPLRPAAAKTIHRCQGDTLNEAVVELPSSSREHMHYVALSRVRSSATLNILNLSEKKICVSQKVQEDMSRLRTQPLVTCVPCLYNTIYQFSKKILFHNVRSLHLHFDDVACDYNVQAADVNIFVETRLCSSDYNTNYQMTNFRLFRNDFNPQSNVRTSYGTVMYIKNNIHCVTTPFRSNFNNIEITVCVQNDPVPNLHIIGIYRSKSKVNLQKLIETTNHLLDAVIPDLNTPTVILGDFNVNLMENSSGQKALARCFLEQRTYTQLITQYTTDYRTQIDHIYTNIPNHVQTAGVLESYYSDHKPVFVSLV